MLLFVCVLSLIITAAASFEKRSSNFSNNGTKLAQNDYRVSNFSNITNGSPETPVPIMFAGQIPLYNENNTHYFFWKFVDPQKSPAAENKTIFWLNGGPGCSSIAGAFLENGPFRVNDRNELSYNQGSWHKKGDIVYVDQPVNTGFSFSENYDTELYDISRHFMKFLEQYFEVFPEDITNEIVLSGESYGGQFLPYIARDILRHNQKSPVKYNLMGLLIGNGYISPAEQSRTFLTYALYENLIFPDNANWNEIMEAQVQCEEAYSEHGNPFGTVTEVCPKVLQTIIRSTASGLNSSNPMCYNIYDHALLDTYPKCGSNWPSEFGKLESFINQDHIKRALNVPVESAWTDCSSEVNQQLKPKNSEAATDFFPELLQEMGIVMYNGNKDFICNTVGAEIIISKLEWGGQTGFSDNLPTHKWRHNGNLEGHMKAERNLTYVNVYDGSHFVVYSKPGPSQALIDILYGNFVVGTGEEGAEIWTFPVFG